MDASELSVVLAADDNFAMPLAVAATSILETIAPGAVLLLYILDMGISLAK